MSLLGVINDSIKISQHTGRQYQTGAGRGPVEEISEGPAMGPHRIDPLAPCGYSIKFCEMNKQKNE